MLSKLLSLVFPPTHTQLLVANTTYLHPQTATVHTPQKSPVLTCADYTDPATSAAIKELKNHGSTQAAKLLSSLLYDTILEEISDIEIWNAKQIIVVPMPLSHKRKRERGFNHVAKVCAQLPTEIRSCVATNVLVQTKHVPMQKTLPRKQRLENVSGIFSIPHPERVRTVHVLLIDDVITTGATMDEAMRTFTDHGISVTAVALTRA